MWLAFNNFIGPFILAQKQPREWFAYAFLTREEINAFAYRNKNLPAMQETQVRSLGWKDPLEKEMQVYSLPTELWGKPQTNEIPIYWKTLMILLFSIVNILSICCSVAKSCMTLCNPVNFRGSQVGDIKMICFIIFSVKWGIFIIFTISKGVS